MTPTGRKMFEDTAEYVVGDPFAVYAGVGLRPATPRRGRSPGRDPARPTPRAAASTSTSTRCWPPTPTSSTSAGRSRSTEAIGVGRGVRRHRLRRQADAAHPPPGRPLRLRHGAARVANLDGTLTTVAGSLVAPLTTADRRARSSADPVTMYVTGQITLLRGPVNAVSVPQQVARRRHLRPAACARRARLRPRLRLPRGEGRSDLLMTKELANGQPKELPAGPGPHDARHQGRRLLRPGLRRRTTWSSPTASSRSP